MREIGRQKQKLEHLIDRIKREKNVQNRDLKTWLTADAWATYVDELATQQALRSEVQKKPDTVREYERLVALANFSYNKGEGFSVRRKSVAARRYFERAEALYECALEHLQEIMAADPSLCVWFDRDTSWTADSEISLCPSAVPHVVTSRSLDNRGGGLLRQIRSKRDLKIAAIEHALVELKEDAKDRQDSEEGGMSERLKRLLARRDDD